MRKMGKNPVLKRKWKDGLDRRMDNPTTPHPGSYAHTHGAELTALAIPEPTVPKRRHALIFAYNGAKYVGMQLNEGINSIEKELERALYLSRGIRSSNFGYLQKIGFTRAARTDKGVHALGQTISAKLHIEDTKLMDFVDRVNSHLPSDIRVWDCIKTTAGFNTKTTCNKRTYEYIAPTYIFAPKTAASENLLDYRLGAEAHGVLNTHLKTYIGTHNYHNFTSRLEYSNPTCNRYILSFEAGTPFEVNGREWIKLTVQGQSFLLHHIRKMIGLVSEIMRGPASHIVIADCFTKKKIDLPKAPSEGLYLGKTHYETYNEGHAVSHGTLDVDTPERKTKVDAFRVTLIDYIISNDKKEEYFLNWLKTLDDFISPYTIQDYEEWASTKKKKKNIEPEMKKDENSEEVNEVKEVKEIKEVNEEGVMQ